MALQLDKEVFVILLDTVELVYHGVSSIECLYARECRNVLTEDFSLHGIAPVKGILKGGLVSMPKLID